MEMSTNVNERPVHEGALQGAPYCILIDLIVETYTVVPENACIAAYLPLEYGTNGNENKWK